MKTTNLATLVIVGVPMTSLTSPVASQQSMVGGQVCVEGYPMVRKYMMFMETRLYIEYRPSNHILHCTDCFCFRMNTASYLVSCSTTRPYRHCRRKGGRNTRSNASLIRRLAWPRHLTFSCHPPQLTVMEVLFKAGVWMTVQRHKWLPWPRRNVVVVVVAAAAMLRSTIRIRRTSTRPAAHGG
jgi:hypothetical protein